MRKTDLEKKYNLSRYNILLFAIFTCINIVMIMANDTYFLFSLTFPRLVQYVINVLIVDGGVPADSINYFVVGIIMAIPVVLLLLSYFLTSKKRYLWFILPLIVIGADSILAVDGLIVGDIIFHLYMIGSIIFGMYYGKKLKKGDYSNYQFDDEELESQVELNNNKTITTYTGEFEEKKEAENSRVLRKDAPKGRVLIKADYEGLEVLVKRRRGLTELIINGVVYDEIKLLIETTYHLSATINNVYVKFKHDNMKMFIFANGKELTKKIRMI
jgi:hypothetical protein